MPSGNHVNAGNAKLVENDTTPHGASSHRYSQVRNADRADHNKWLVARSIYRSQAETVSYFRSRYDRKSGALRSAPEACLWTAFKFRITSGENPFCFPMLNILYFLLNKLLISCHFTFARDCKSNAKVPRPVQVIPKRKIEDIRYSKAQGTCINLYKDLGTTIEMGHTVEHQLLNVVVRWCNPL